MAQLGNWRGVETGTHYRFLPASIPAALLDAVGNPVVEGQWNGELVIQCNNDGSVARGVAAASPTVYDPGAAYSPWERAIK